MKIRLLDLTGRILMNESSAPGSGTVNLSHVNGGLYLIEFSNDHITYQKTILVER